MVEEKMTKKWNTTNLQFHLDNHHKLKATSKAQDERSSQPKIDQFSKGAPGQYCVPVRFSKARQAEVDDALMKLMIVKVLPLSLVENNKFRDFVQLLEPRPLRKRLIPEYPLYYKGDPQRQVFLPLFWMKVIPPEEKVPKNYVHFIVHPQMNKCDIKQYLKKIYSVPVLSVRTELRIKNIRANVFAKGYIEQRRDTIWREEEKYAYVQLKPECEFKYPNFFKENEKTKNMSNLSSLDEQTREIKKTVSRKTPSVGLPCWFTGLKTKKKSDS